MSGIAPRRRWRNCQARAAGGGLIRGGREVRRRARAYRLSLVNCAALARRTSDVSQIISAQLAEDFGSGMAKHGFSAIVWQVVVVQQDMYLSS